MASTKINTVQILDSRIEPQPQPTYAITIGPDQNQWYYLTNSGMSQSSINFNNLTTLGKDRAYLDSFELLLTAEVQFNVKANPDFDIHKAPVHGLFMPQSFPFNSVCDQVQVNINGGAFFNNPSQIIRAKERYWDQYKIQASYGNICPCTRPAIQNEIGMEALDPTDMYSLQDNEVGRTIHDAAWAARLSRSRMIGLQGGNAASALGPYASTNYSILPNYPYTKIPKGEQTATGPGDKITIQWREPIMCSPFSSRYDETYGRPLYNITSIDIQFKMFGTLKNMFICLAPWEIDSWDVVLTDAQICYQVMTVTAPVPHDITVVPYRRYVPYITNYVNSTTGANGSATDITMKSGVYTLNEVPTAIWIYAAPQLGTYQDFLTQDEAPDQIDDARNYIFLNRKASNTCNKLFGFMKKISISCGNTTQILSTAQPQDLYRIAKANGCQDSYVDWAVSDSFKYSLNPIRYCWGGDDDSIEFSWDKRSGEYCEGPGSVLRLIPGVDIVLPEQRLIPGANANSLVFQVEATFDFKYATGKAVPIALWILFEYVGVATFTPGNCMVTMNPLGNGAVMSSAPVVAASDLENVSTTEGSGWLDKIKNVFSKINTFAKQKKIVSSLLSQIPEYGPMLSGIAQKLGYGDRGVDDDDDDDDDMAAAPSVAKRPRGGNITGGAIMGLGDFC